MSITIINGINISSLSSNISSAMFSLAGTESLGSSVSTTIIYDNPTSTPNLTYNSTNGLFTIARAGLYTWSVMTVFAINATGTRYTYLIYNLGSDRLSQNSIASPLSADYTSLSSTLSLFMNVGDTMQIQGLQTSGASLAIIGSTTSSQSFFNFVISMFL